MQKHHQRTHPWLAKLQQITISLLLLLGLSGAIAPSAWAVVDPYVAQYLKVLPGAQAEIQDDGQGSTKAFGYDELLAGKDRFGTTCLSCHVGGSTIASPDLALSLDNLKAMVPPRDSIASLMDYMRNPIIADGSEESYACRKVEASWINDPDLEQIAAFVLRAAEIAPGWGTARF